MIENDYKYVFDEFELYFPGIASEVVNWYPSGRHEITVKLDDRSLYTFNFLNKTIRRIPKFNEESQAISEEFWKKEFSNRLSTILADRCISQLELSERTGISQVSISNYITGKAMPSSYTVSRIARALECSISELTDFS